MIERDGNRPDGASPRAGFEKEASRGAGCLVRERRHGDGRALVCVEGLGLRYGGQVALHDVSLRVRQGKILAIVGPSGCGKTSLLLCMNRLTDLVPGARVTGSVRIGGVEIHGASTDVVRLRRRVGMIFQRPNPFPLSIRRNLTLALREQRRMTRREEQEIVEKGLRDVGLWKEVRGRLDEPATRLSGGQQQRLCLARALVLEPELLLLDEPCSSLDPISSQVVEDLVAGLRGRYTVVVVTHNLAQARRLADDAALFWSSGGAGRLVEAAPRDRFFDHPRDPLTAAYVRGERG